MNASRVIALVIVSITLSVSASLLFLNSPDPITQTIEDTAEKILPLENEKSSATYAKAKKPEETTTTQEHQITPQQAENPKSKYANLIDETSINSFFISNQGTVNGVAITDVLTIGMTDFIEQASSLHTSSEIAIKRQDKLSQQLLQLKDMAIYDQQLICSGQICALSLTTNELSEENRMLVSEFDSNISFVNTSDNAAGEVEFKAIYLHSEDPSQLVMTQP
ncbi:hypothetical protein Shal_0009 [Shewanella halifaxensis HAW-EB4]|uniref:Uncharacterized protein n=1 Tax=Shewanella halifaxensis (strain HAW-EB4) TaxID=458817 RepID=B0TLB2_SHEHH|nr:hypothetical protein [Shewanella halifaxensis]ABZ74585.1 hypothetical protein Shal_0009 [Shewanella halifaxensis HAW-EB4]